MAFDVGHHSWEPQPLPPERKTLQDRLDVALRAVVLAPLLGLYTWAAVTIVRDLAFALIARFNG